MNAPTPWALEQSSGRSSPELGFSAEPRPGAVQCSPHQGLGLLVTADDAKPFLPTAFRHSFARNTNVFFIFFKGGERHKSEVWPWLVFSSLGCFIHIACPGSQWWRFTCFCLCAKSRSPWQAVYSLDRTMKDWHRKETFLPAKVLVHIYSTSVFLFSKSHLPSECNQSPGGLRNKRMNLFHMLSGPWG